MERFSKARYLVGGLAGFAICVASGMDVVKTGKEYPLTQAFSDNFEKKYKRNYEKTMAERWEDYYGNSRVLLACTGMALGSLGGFVSSSLFLAGSARRFYGACSNRPN